VVAVGGSGGAVVTGGASALPPAIDQEELFEAFFSGRFTSARLARAAFSAAGIRRRHAVVDPRVEDCSSWTTARRMDRFVEEALPLAKAAVADALAAARLEAGNVGLLAVVSCTGYATPGIDVLVARDLGLSPRARRLLIGHVGCHAALPGLAAVGDFVALHGEPAVLCCLELPSLHVQPADDDPGQALVHALFGDAAAALVLEPGPAAARRKGVGGTGSLELLATAARSDLAEADQMTWTVTDRGFRMHLARHVPQAVGKALAPLLDELLAPYGLRPSDIDRWAVHPGGPRVLDTVADRLGLGEEALACSRSVLAEHGNCSSATVLLVLEALCAKEPPRRGEHVVLLAFGPGISLYGALLRGR